MDETKDGFLFYRSFYESFIELEDKDAKKLIEAICEFSLNNNEIELSGVVKAVFQVIRPIIDKNKRNFNNGKKGGRPKVTGFKKPTLLEVEEYSKQYSFEKNKELIEADTFIDFYESKGWLVGKSPMKDWKAALRQWYKSQPEKNNNTFAGGWTR